jgi:hypothetical protein
MHCRPLVAHVGPTLASLPRPAEVLYLHRERVLIVEQLLADGAEVVLQRFANVAKRLAGELFLEVFNQLIKRLDQDLGVANFSKRSARVAKKAILIPVLLFSNFRSDETKKGPHSLE